MVKKKKEISKSEKELAEIKAILQRTHADFINYKARAEKEKTESVECGKIQAIKELLPIFDNLKRAESHLPKDLEKNEWVQGVLNITKQLDAKLAEIGIERIATIGEQFDPNFHEALVCEDCPGKSNEIIEEFEPGYLYQDKVIKYAKVKIAK